MTLYELTSEYKELLAMMEDPDVDPEVLQDTMEAVGGEIEDKAENYARVIRELEADQAKFEKEAERCSKHANICKNNIKRMKENLKDSMIATGKLKFPTEHFKFSVVKNGGLQPLKITGDVPDDFKIMKPETDNNKIREALERGVSLDFAHLEERGTHVNIK